MAKITHIHLVKRPICARGRAVLEVASDDSFISLWIREAGQEGQSATKFLSAQLDHKTAKKLVDCLANFLSES